MVKHKLKILIVEYKIVGKIFNMRLSILWALQPWTMYCRKINKIKLNRCFFAMLYNRFFAIL